MHHSIDAMLEYYRANGSLRQAAAFINRHGPAKRTTNVAREVVAIRGLAALLDRDPSIRRAESRGWQVSRTEDGWELSFDALLWWSVEGNRRAESKS